MRMLWPTGLGEGAGRGADPVDAEHTDDVGVADVGVDIDPAEVYGADSRSTPADRPWVLGNMIASVDGAATDPNGRSAGLGGPADHRVFSAIRAVADIVLAGAGTVRTERYGPARLAPSLEEARRARGQSARPRVAVVTRSLALDLELPLFADATDEDRPIVITTTAGLDRVRSTGGATATRELAMVAEILVAGDESVEWGVALPALRATAGADVVLVEGGPTTIGQLVAADFLDELCLTVSPQLAGAGGLRVVGVGWEAPRRLAVDRILIDDDFLFLRYLRARGDA